MYEHLLQVAGDHCRSTNISRKLQGITVGLRTSPASCRRPSVGVRTSPADCRRPSVGVRTSPADCRRPSVGVRTSPADCRRSPSVGEHLPQVAGDQPSVGEHLPQIAGDHRQLANISRKLQEITVGWRTSPADCRSLLCPPAIRPYEKGEERDASLFRPDSCAVSF